jgi:hypothetical protein
MLNKGGGGVAGCPDHSQKMLKAFFCVGVCGGLAVLSVMGIILTFLREDGTGGNLGEMLALMGLAALFPL